MGILTQKLTVLNLRRRFRDRNRSVWMKPNKWRFLCAQRCSLIGSHLNGKIEVYFLTKKKLFRHQMFDINVATAKAHLRRFSQLLLFSVIKFVCCAAKNNDDAI